MTDWKTCSVVRDRDGDLWGRERGGWNLITSGDTESWAPSDDFLADHYGPITPVLDADGLPVVRTVGDLTMRHVGLHVRIDDTPRAYRIAEGELTDLTSAPRGNAWIVVTDDESTITWPSCSLSAPCEVLDD